MHSASSAEHLHSLGVDDVIVGDIRDGAIVAEAVRGADLVYHVGPNLHPGESEMGFAIVDAARAEGVRHVVFSSVLHSISTALVQHAIKRDIEEHLVSSGVNYTILQPSNFMLPLKLKPAFERGVFELSWSLDRLQSLVDLGDITDVAAMVLQNPQHHAGATYELVSDGPYDAHQLGAIISRVLGRPIDVREIDADTYLRAWIGDGDPLEHTHMIRVLRAISAHYSSTDFVGNSNVLTWLLGRTPTTFEDYVRRQWESFSATRSP